MSSSLKIAGVILAAGEGRRMGRTKQLLPFKGQTIIECVLDNVLESALDQVIVVLGHQCELLEPLLERKGVEMAHNHDYAAGQSTSVKAALRAIAGTVDAVLFLLADQPLISPEIINAVLDAFRSSPGRPIVFPVFDHQRGNPVLFSRSTFSRLELLSGDQGARPLFEEYAGQALAVPVNDPAILFDVDTEEDYRALLAR